MLCVRWLGAFGNGPNLHEALNWELTQQDREVSAEIIRNKGPQAGKSHIAYRARIGLVVCGDAVNRVYDCDVWSNRGSKSAKVGLLQASRYAALSKHAEAFCSPRYRSIVVKNLAGLPTRLSRTVLFFAQRHNLTILDYKELTKKQ